MIAHISSITIRFTIIKSAKNAARILFAVVEPLCGKAQQRAIAMQRASWHPVSSGVSEWRWNSPAHISVGSCNLP
jgi:hypothetical protein